MFCPKCKSLLRPKQMKDKKVLACSCGYTSDNKENTAIKETVKHSKDIEVVEEVETLPLVDIECKKCSNHKAYFWSIQTRASDEPETRFYRCQKCRHTWREYK